MANPTWDDTTPTWDNTTEVQSVPMEEAPSESALMQSVQALPVALGRGMSFGLANEAGAALGGLAGATATQLDPRQNITREEILATLSPEVRVKATEVVKPKAEDFSNLLAEYYKVGKKGQSDVEAAAPVISLAGNIAGGIATMKLPGLSQLSTLKSAGLGGKIVEGAAKGAVAGGVSGLTGEGETVGERLGDAGTGTLVGGVLGGGIPLVGSVAKSLYGTAEKIGSKLTKSEFIKQFPEYFKAGRAGKSLTSSEDLEKYASELYDQAEKMGVDVSELAGETISKIKSTVAEATDSGKKVNIKGLLSEQLDSIKQDFEKMPIGKERQDLGQLSKELSRLKDASDQVEGLLTPEQLYKQERGFAKLGAADLTKKYETVQERKRIVDAFKDLMKKEISPEVQKRQTDLSNIKSFGETLGIKDFDPEDVTSINKLFSTLRTAGKPGNITKEKQLSGAFEQLKKVPEGEKIVSKYAPKMEDLSKSIRMTEGLIGGKAGGGYARAKLLTLANIAGEVTPEWAVNTANAIRQGSTKASQFVADQLEKIAVEPNKEKKNAIMFGLMQNPAYRELLGQHVEGESNE